MHNIDISQYILYTMWALSALLLEAFPELAVWPEGEKPLSQHQFSQLRNVPLSLIFIARKVHFEIRKTTQILLTH